jgi:hypothetical protein
MEQVQDYPREGKHEDPLVAHRICRGCFDLSGLGKHADLQTNPLPFSASAAFLFRLSLVVVFQKEASIESREGESKALKCGKRDVKDVLKVPIDYS